MLGKKQFRRLIVATLGALALPLSSAVAVAQDLESLPPKPQLSYPNLGSRLNELATSVEEGRASAQSAAAQAAVSDGESVAVTIYLSGNVDAVVSFLEANGGSPRNVGEDYIEAYVPVSLLGQTSQQPGVGRIREIVPPHPHYGPIPGQGGEQHGSPAWHLDGNTGRGVKVGIIDNGFRGFTALMGTELPASVKARCYTDFQGSFSTDPADCAVNSVHGTAVAESVLDIAPDVSLYIATPYTEGDLAQIVTWMVSEDVDVINQSLGWLFDGPGDGSSPFSSSPLKAVDAAVTGGIIWLNSAGNNARETWFGPFSDTDRDGILEMTTSPITDETINLDLFGNNRIVVQLRWDGDWGKEDTDLDLVLLNADLKVVAGGYAFQPGASSIPWELLVYTVPSSGTYHLTIAHRSGSAPAWLQVAGWYTGSIEHYTESYSITNPAESANPGMLAVGAAPYSFPETIEDFSSRGPAPDGRVKPDIVGVDCAQVASYSVINYPAGQQCWFPGTSQASPHMAGLAALVRQRFPDFTPAQVASFLKDHAVQRTETAPNNIDPNNIWGHGLAQLPAPVACQQTITENGAISDDAWVSYCQKRSSDKDYSIRDYAFTLAAQRTVTIDLESDSVDTYLNLYSGTTKTDNPLGSNDNISNTDTDSRISQTLDAGSYTIEATTASAGVTGDYTLTVSGLPAASAGVTVSKTALTLGENGATGTYTVRLHKAPTADVTVTPASSDTGIVTVSDALTFTQTNYATPQTVTVTAVSDDLDAGNRTATISHTVSATGGYDTVTASIVTVTLTNTNKAGVRVKPTLTVDESHTNTYTVTLNSKPTENVTVTPASSDTGIVTVSGALTFTATNWDTSQTVIVTGVNNNTSSPTPRTATVSHTTASMDGKYNNLSAPGVAVRVAEDDPGISLSKSTLTVAENAGVQTYTVTLNSKPTANVTVTPASSDTGIVTVSGALTFTATNWDTSQTVIVTGVNNNTSSPTPRTATVSHTTASMDGKYNNLSAPGVAVRVAEDDPGISLSKSTLTVAENAGVQTYTVTLNSKPTANVTVTPASSLSGAVRFTPTSLTFTPTNYSWPLSMTVTGVDDSVSNLGRTTVISHTPTSDDTAYNTLSQTPDITVTLTEDDAVTIDPTTLSVPESGTATYTVVLESEPTANVTVTPTSSDTDKATVSDALTFTQFNYATAQTVTVSGVNDTLVNPGRTATISHTVSATGGYTSVTAPSVAVTLEDDDRIVRVGGGGGGGAPRDQHGNTPATATRVTVGSSTPGEINSLRDQDYFTLSVPQAGLLVVETTGFTDTQGTLSTPEGQVLAQADTGGTRRNFRLSTRVTAGTYLAVVTGTRTGSYRLEVDLIVGFVDNPQPQSAQSGIGVLSGWVCKAETVEVELSGVLYQAAYGTERTDTVDQCGDTNNGFGLLYNWNKLGDGAHTVRVVVDGIEFATLPVTVTTLGLGEEFPTGLRGEATLVDFPSAGETSRLVWQEAQQNFALAEGPVTQSGTTRDWTWAVLGNPALGSYQSGIRIISGWVCEAEEVVLEIDGKRRLIAAYGTERTDTADHCGDTNNGFGLLWNWNKLTDGPHTMRLLVDGEEWATATFTVTTLGEEFRRGLVHTGRVADFPGPGQVVTVEWQEAQQNFVITGVE